jgi:hypothetical protein
MLDRTPSRRDLEASATVETLSLRGHRARAEPSHRVDFRDPRQPEDPGTPAITTTLAGGEISRSATSHNGDQR